MTWTNVRKVKVMSGQMRHFGRPKMGLSGATVWIWTSQTTSFPHRSGFFLFHQVEPSSWRKRMDKQASPRSLVRKVQDVLPDTAPSSIMSESSMMSMLHESELVKDHKSYVRPCSNLNDRLGTCYTSQNARKSPTSRWTANSQSCTKRCTELPELGHVLLGGPGYVLHPAHLLPSGRDWWGFNPWNDPVPFQLYESQRTLHDRSEGKAKTVDQGNWLCLLVGFRVQTCFLL